MKGRLFLVPTPLDFGVTNGAPPSDLSAVLSMGVIDVAARLQHWVAENAKTARAFLKRVNQVRPLEVALQSLHIVELPRPAKDGRRGPDDDMAALLAPALQGHDMGLVSEAGMPAVADPGAALVHAAHTLGVTVHPLAGPSALLLALAASGLNGQNFAFVGYLPVDAAQRVGRIRELEALSKRCAQTQMMIETPYRNEALFNALRSGLAVDTQLSISCGLTLAQGWSRTDSVAGWRKSAVTLPKDIPTVFSLLAR